MITNLAFCGDPAVKQMYLDRMLAHAEADEIIKGVYWENGKGCAVGCTIHGDTHEAYDDFLGQGGQMLAQLEDQIFEGLPNSEAKSFPLAFLQAIPAGADLSRVGWRFLHWLLADAEVNPGIDNELVRDAVAECAAVIASMIVGEGSSSVASAANAGSAARNAEIAANAAWSAGSAGSAAWSAGWSAASAASAACSAAKSAWIAENDARSVWSSENAASAARSAWGAKNAASAAGSAARSAEAAWSAARSAENAGSAGWNAAYKLMGNKLLELLAQCRPPIPLPAITGGSA